MGKSAVVAHAQGEKHKTDIRLKVNSKINFHFKPKTPETGSLRSSGSSSLETTVSGSASSSTSTIPALSSTSSLVSTSTTSSSSSASSSSSSSESSYFINSEELTRIEAMWCFMLANSNMSTHCSNDANFLFRNMFPNDKVARNFQCAETKSRYIITHGLGKYLEMKLKDSVKNNEFVLLFDESLNKKLHQKQLDVHMGVWEAEEIKTKYLTSKFVGAFLC